MTWTGNRAGRPRRRQPAVATFIAAACVILASGVFEGSAGGDASVDVSASIRPHLAYLGDTCTLTITASGTSKGDASAHIPSVDGLNFSGPSVQRNTQTSIINGTITHIRTVTLTYKVTPLRNGEFRIPPVTVTLDGGKYRTGPVVFRVSEPPSDDAIMLKTVVSREECRPGQPVDVSCMWYVAEDIEGYTYTIPLLDIKDELSLEVKTAGPSLLEGKLIDDAASRYGEPSRIEISGYEVPVRKFAVSFGGVSYIVYAVTFRIYPVSPGEHSFGSAAVKAKVQHGTKMVVDQFWGRKRRVADYKTLYAYGDPVSVRVAALPETGMPRGFTGAVGEYSIEVSADEQVVKVGDPVRLRISISGEGLLSLVKRPLLSEQPAFDGFQVTESLEPGQVDKDEGRVVFEQVVRPASEDIEEIPPVEFSFFDADAGRYRTVGSRPAPMKVLPTRIVTAEDVFGRSSISPGMSAKKVEVMDDVIRTNYNHVSILDDQGMPFTGLLAVAGFPPAVYAALLFAVRRRRRLRGDRRYSRQKRAAGKADTFLKQAKNAAAADNDGEFFDAVAAAVGGYVSDMLDLGKGELTVGDIQDLLGKGALSDDAATKTAAVLERCDMGRFGSVPLHGEEQRRLLATARDAMAAVRKGAF